MIKKALATQDYSGQSDVKNVVKLLRHHTRALLSEFTEERLPALPRKEQDSAIRVFSVLLNNPFKVHESFYAKPALPTAIFTEVLSFVD
jgi:hypothetical protein